MAFVTCRWQPVATSNHVAAAARVAAGTVARPGWSVKTLPHGPSMCAASAAALGLAQL